MDQNKMKIKKEFETYRRASQSPHRDRSNPESNEEENEALRSRLHESLKKNSELEKKYEKLKVEIKKAIYQMDLLEAQNNELLEENELLNRENNSLRLVIKNQKKDKPSREGSPSPEKIQNMREKIKDLAAMNEEYKLNNEALQKKIDIIEENLESSRHGSKILSQV